MTADEIREQLDAAGRAFEAADQARDELIYDQLHDSWETAIKRHRRLLPHGARATTNLRLVDQGVLTS